MVITEQLIGSNKQYVDKLIPDLAECITDNIHSVINSSEVILITQKHEELAKIVNNNSNKFFIDVVRFANTCNSNNYQGICW